MLTTERVIFYITFLFKTTVASLHSAAALQNAAVSLLHAASAS